MEEVFGAFAQVDFVTKMFETNVPVRAVFEQNEMIDVIGSFVLSIRSRVLGAPWSEPSDFLPPLGWL